MLPSVGQPRVALLLALAVGWVACSRRSTPKPAAAPKPVRAVPAARPEAHGRCLFADETSKYTVVFAAPPARVKAIFAGWRQPGPPRMTVVRNFLTGKDEMVTTTDPDDADGGVAAQEWDLRQNEIARDAGYAGYLESRIPAEVRALPHRAMKRVVFELMAVAKVLTAQKVLTPHDELPDALYPPGGCETSLPLLRLSDAAVSALRALDDDGAAKLAGRLAKDEEFRDWDAADVRAFVADLRALATASATAGLYVLPV